MIQKLTDNPDGHDIAEAVNCLVDIVETEFKTLWAKVSALEADVKKLMKKPTRKKT